MGFLQKAPLDDKGLTFHFHPANYFRLARTDQLIAKEMIRQQLRRARKGTQVSLARSMGITQDAVSRLEKRTDMLLSTLSHYVEAMGGRLSLVAEFPDSNPVILSGICDSGPDPKRGRRKRPKRTNRYHTVSCIWIPRPRKNSTISLILENPVRWPAGVNSSPI